MAEARKGVFWDVIAGRAPLPPVLGLLGWNVIEAEPGHVRAAFQGREEFYNPVGLVQGGILAAMLDGVMGAEAVSLLDQNGEGRVVHRGRSVIFTEGSLTAEDGSLVAVATSTARIVTLSADARANKGD